MIHKIIVFRKLQTEVNEFCGGKTNSGPKSRKKLAQHNEVSTLVPKHAN